MRNHENEELRGTGFNALDVCAVNEALHASGHRGQVSQETNP